MLEFFDADEKVGYSSIYENHITFNKELLKYFSDCYRVRVGIDKEEEKAFIFLMDKDYALSGEVSESSLLKISLSKSFARISSRSLVDYVAKSFNLKIKSDGAIKLKAIFDEKKKAIVIFMVGEA
jgi:hypothetical protein